MKRTVVVIAASLVLGFVLQAVVALATWWSAFEGNRGWALDAIRIDPAWMGDRVVNAYDGRQNRQGWHERNAFLVYSAESSWMMRIDAVTAYSDADAYEWLASEPWPSVGNTGGEPAIVGSQMRVRCGMPFGSLGGTSADELLRADPQSERFPDIRILGSVESDVLSRDGWVLPRMTHLPLGPSVDRRLFPRSATRTMRMRMVPTRLYPLATLGNSLIWAVPMFASWFAIAALSKRWRSGRDLCVKCKYQLAGLTTCPECGTSIEKGEALFPRADGDESPPDGG